MAKQSHAAAKSGPPGQEGREGRKRQAQAALPPAFFLTDNKRCPDPLKVAGALPEGFGVILRDYHLASRRALAVSLAAVCRQQRLIFLVGGDRALAESVEADGLHLPERMIGDFQRRTRGPLGLVTAAGHSPEAIERAAGRGIDAVLLSPVFPTRSHPSAEAIGLTRFSEILERSPLPLYALGGLTPDRVRALPKHKRLAGFAGIGMFVEGAGISEPAQLPAVTGFRP